MIFNALTNDRFTIPGDRLTASPELIIMSGNCTFAYPEGPEVSTLWDVGDVSLKIFSDTGAYLQLRTPSGGVTYKYIEFPDRNTLWGEEFSWYFKLSKNDSGSYTVDFRMADGVSPPGSMSLRDGIFTEGSNVRIGDISNVDSEWRNINLNDVELFDLYSDQVGSAHVGSDGTVGTITTSSVDPDYINDVIRADNIPALHEVSIFANNGFTPIEGATVTVWDEFSVPDTKISDEYGEAKFDLFNGDYTYQFSATHFQVTPAVPAAFKVEGLTKKIYQDATYTPTTNTKFTTSTKNGTDEAQASVEGDSLVFPDGLKKRYSSGVYNVDRGYLSDKTDYHASILDLRKAPKANIGATVSTLNHYATGGGGGLNFVCVSNDALGDGWKDNGGTVIVSSVNDAYEASLPDKYISSNAFGLLGNGVREDSSKVQALFDYASEKKLKIVMASGRTYVIDGLQPYGSDYVSDPSTRALTLVGGDYYVDVDWNGSILKRHWQVKSMPYRLEERVELGTFVSKTPNLNSKSNSYYDIEIASSGNTIARKVIDCTSSIEFDTAAGKVGVGGYVQDQFSTNHELRKITGLSPTTYLKDSIVAVFDQMRDRYFIANANLSKRFKVKAGTVDAITGTESVFNLYQTYGDDLTVGETLYWYNYVTNRLIEHNPTGQAGSVNPAMQVNETTGALEESDIVCDEDLAYTGTETLYRAPGAAYWERYTSDKIPPAPIYLKGYKHFKWTGLNFTGERESFSMSMDLAQCIDNNYLNNGGDQTCAFAWQQLIKTANGADSTNSTFELYDCKFLNSNMMEIMVADATNRRFKKLYFNDIGRIRATGGTASDFNTMSKVDIEDIEIHNPYLHDFRNKGVRAGGTDVRVKDIRAYNTTLQFGLFGTDKAYVDGIKMTRVIGRDLDPTNPWLNGKSLPKKNGGVWTVFRKSGDTGYHRWNDVSYNNIKIDSISAYGGFSCDRDPVTGTFLDITDTQVWYCRVEDGAGNMHFKNSDIIGQLTQHGPTTPGGGASLSQKAGAYNTSVLNCQYKAFSGINKIYGSVNANVINGLRVLGANVYDKTQHRFYHPYGSGTLSLGGNVQNVQSNIPIRFAFSGGSLGSGFFSYNLWIDDYQNDESLAIYNTGGGGNYTEQSPVPGNKSINGRKYVAPTLAAMNQVTNITGAVGHPYNQKLSITATPTDGQTVSIDGRTYTFRNTPIVIDDVKIATSGISEVNAATYTIPVNAHFLKNRRPNDGNTTWTVPDELEVGHEIIVWNGADYGTPNVKFVAPAGSIITVSEGNIGVGNFARVLKTSATSVVVSRAFSYSNYFTTRMKIVLSIKNLVAAINGDSKYDGTSYFTGTTQHATAKANEGYKYESDPYAMIVSHRTLNDTTHATPLAATVTGSWVDDNLTPFNAWDGTGVYEDYGVNGFTEVADEEVYINSWHPRNSRRKTPSTGASVDLAVRENMGMNKPGGRSITRNVTAPTVFINQSAYPTDAYEAKTVFENVSKIYVGQFEMTAEAGSGKLNWGRFEFKNCDFYQTATYKPYSNKVRNWNYPFMESGSDAFFGMFNTDTENPVINLYEGCRYIATMNSNLGHKDNRYQIIDMEDFEAKNGSYIKYIHPQFKMVRMKGTSALNLDRMTTKYSNHNHRFTVNIAGTSDGRFYFEGNLYSTPGNYMFKVEQSIDSLANPVTLGGSDHVAYATPLAIPGTNVDTDTGISITANSNVKNMPYGKALCKVDLHNPGATDATVVVGFSVNGGPVVDSLTYTINAGESFTSWRTIMPIRTAINSGDVLTMSYRSDQALELNDQDVDIETGKLIMEDSILSEPKEVSAATYTVLDSDTKLKFTSATGCVVTLPVTTKVGQEISHFNYCGVGQTVTFVNDGTSSVIGGLSTLAYGKYAGSEVIDTNIWSLTGDLT